MERGIFHFPLPTPHSPFPIPIPIPYSPIPTPYSPIPTNMTRITEKFIKLRNEGRKAFIPYITAGDPDLATTERLLLALADAGADVIELRRSILRPDGRRTCDSTSLGTRSEKFNRSGRYSPSSRTRARTQ